MTSRRAAGVLAMLATAFAVAAVWLAHDNPEINHTSRGDSYNCLAPWDTVLNDADNFPGGDPPVDGEEIAARCRDAGRDRFNLAVGAGALGLGAATGAFALRLNARRSFTE